MAKRIQTKQDYEEFKECVAIFMERKGLESLTKGTLVSHCCDEEFDKEGRCLQCHKEPLREPYFSYSPCGCCGEGLPGNRYSMVGTTRKGTKRQYEVCTDCMYYGVYGHLNDQTMLDIETNSTGG